MDLRFNVKHKTMTLLENNMKENLSNLWLVKSSQTWHQSIIHKMKNWKAGLHPRGEKKKLLHCKKLSYEDEKSSYRLGENLQTTYLIKLLSPIYKVLSKLAIETIQLENGQRQEETVHWRRYTDSKQAHEKISNLTSH